MKIAFYCPMKSPNHPVPSGDRLMARLLMQAMQHAGHEVEVVSELRSFVREPNGDEVDALARAAERERQRISALWKSHGAPDLWFCYHPYYKALDRLGPHLSRSYAIPYVTAEASYSPKRNASGWAEVQATLLKDLSGQYLLHPSRPRRSAKGQSGDAPADAATLPRHLPLRSKDPGTASRANGDGGDDACRRQAQQL